MVEAVRLNSVSLAVSSALIGESSALPMTLMRVMFETVGTPVRTLVSETINPGEPPLPTLEDKHNRCWVDTEESVMVTGGHRDLWELNPPRIPEQDRRLRNVMEFIDFPTDEERATHWKERLLFE